MYRGMITAVALAAFISVGCEEKREGPTDAATDAADRAANQGQEALDKAEKATEKATENAAEKADNAASQVESNAGNVQEHISKANEALSNNKFDEASTHVKQAEDMLAKLPAAAQGPIKQALDEVKVKIQEGKNKLMPAQ